MPLSTGGMPYVMQQGRSLNHVTIRPNCFRDSNAKVTDPKCMAGVMS
jgi:hypothetical protein